MVVCRITSIIKRKRGQRLRKELRRALGGREELQADWEHTAVVLREARMIKHRNGNVLVIEESVDKTEDRRNTPRSR